MLVLEMSLWAQRDDDPYFVTTGPCCLKIIQIRNAGRMRVGFEAPRETLIGRVRRRMLWSTDREGQRHECIEVARLIEEMNGPHSQ